MEYFGLRQELHAAGFYETEHHRQIIKDIRATVGGGRLIAVTGIVGSGKAMSLRHLQAELDREGWLVGSARFTELWSIALARKVIRARTHQLLSN